MSRDSSIDVRRAQFQAEAFKTRAHRLFVSLLLTLWASYISGCLTVGQPNLTDSPIRDCSLAGFSQAEFEHIIDELPTPFFVREVRGHIGPDEGRWPSGHPVKLEIRMLKPKDSPAKLVKIDPRGDFGPLLVDEGTYCFKGTAPGWRSVMGILVITDRADLEKSVNISMALAQ